jgi:hypothetical protein
MRRVGLKLAHRSLGRDDVQEALTPQAECNVRYAERIVRYLGVR